MGDSVHCPPLDAKLHAVIFEKCLALLGLPKTYALIGGRTCGSAYLSNGRVYKITTDKSEAVESNKLIGQKNAHLVDIFDVKKVNNTLTNVDVYLIVMEHLKTNREAIFADAQDMLDHLFEEAFDRNFLDILYEYRFSPDIYKNEYEYEVNEILKSHQREKLYYESLLRIVDELRANNIDSLDLQYHNLGVKPNGNIAFFDLGYGDSKGNVQSMRINERVKSYMKNSSAVGIAKKCKFGGNPDGTSNACNKGDISNITLKSIQEGQDVKIEYGALMLQFDVKNWKKITDVIEKDDVYDEPTFGLETDPHVTILYGFHDDVTFKQVSDLLKEKHNPKDEIEIELIGISHFETPKYDVVKFDVKSDKLVELNKLVKKLPFTSDYPDYHPHMTLSYVKKGTGKKYDEKFDEPIKLKSNKIVYSTVDEKKRKLNEVKFYRVDSGFFPPKGTTALDVVNFEAEENGNVEEMQSALQIAQQHGIDLSKYPASKLMWVTKTPEHAQRYGSEVEEYEIPNPIILADDGDNGYLVFMNEHTSRHNKIYQKKMVAEDLKIGLNDLPFKKDVEQAGGKLYSVGGAVRDTILGKESKDLDILITGIPLEQLEQILSKYGKVDSVGKSFGIIKFNTPQTGEIDIAIPRTERKNDQGGYQGFDVTSDHNLPIEKDLERRDFTINAIAKDSSGLMIDPYGGQGDIEKKQIKMVNPQAFSDDPLRMLRAVQFAARFGFDIEPTTMQAIQQNAAKIREISPERILIEFDKIVKKGNQMVGAKLLRQTGLYNQIFGVNRGINLADFKNSKTMAEFVFGLIGDAVASPAEFYKNNLKGDLETYNELRALEKGNKFTGDRKTIFDMYKLYPKSVDTGIFGGEFSNVVQYMRSHNIPFSLKDVPVTGDDLMQLGYQGKQIGDAFVDILNKIYKEELPNEREAILNYVKR